MGIIDRILNPLVQSRAKQMVDDLIGGFLPLREDTAFREADYDSAYDFQFSEPYQKSQDKAAAWPAGVRIGEWTLQERKDILLRCHLAWERNPLAKGGINVIRGFVVSTGLSVSYQNERVKLILENFRNGNRRNIQRWERQWFDQLLVDGEVFIRVKGKEGKGTLASVSASTLKPWLVEAGESEEGNRDAIVAYHVRAERGTGLPGNPYLDAGTNLEVVPAEEIVHCYINSMAYDVRGRSELFVILPWMRAHREWLENRARINRYQGFLYHLQLAGATPGQVTAKRTAMRQPPAPGSVYVSSDLEKLEEKGGRIDAGRAAEDGRQIKLMSLVGLGLPEYMLSEGENANLATARSQQLPALRTFLTYQDIYIEELWKPLYEAVLELAGLDLEDEVEQQDNEGKATGRMIRVRDAFTVSAQQIVDEDPKSLAEALALHDQLGLASKATQASRAGYDYDKEKKLMALEDKEETDAVFQGRKLGSTVPVAAVSRGNGQEPEEEEE